MEKMKNIVDSSISNPDFSVEILAQDMCLSRAQMYRTCKALTGITPVELIRNTRMERARSLFQTGNTSVTDVALQVGILDPSYFTRCYKTHFGVVPREDIKGGKNQKPPSYFFLQILLIILHQIHCPQIRKMDEFAVDNSERILPNGFDSPSIGLQYGMIMRKTYIDNIIQEYKRLTPDNIDFIEVLTGFKYIGEQIAILEQAGQECHRFHLQDILLFRFMTTTRYSTPSRPNTEAQCLF